MINSETAKLGKWNNDDNCNFHEHIGRTFQKWAVQGGLETGCDIEIVYPYIVSKYSIMELGAAYGRVIKNLLERGYKNKLFAVERSKYFYNKLIHEFNNNQIVIINADIQTFAPDFKVDAILMLWSFISEFPKQDQLDILKRVSLWLNPQGLIIMDTLLHTLMPKNAILSNSQSYIIPFEQYNCYGYTPSKEEVNKYAMNLNVKSIKQIAYKTKTERHRILHILSF
jgi:hypothetical protein